MNSHWPEKSLTIVEDKLGKRFCKTSLNAREYLFLKSVDKKSVWPYETRKLAKECKKECQIVMN